MKTAPVPHEARIATGDSGVHYDTPPVVFERLLDANMNYSSGYYLTGEEDLDQAQRAKMDKIAAMCGFQPGARVLDLGCGWSGPATYFADVHGCRVTGYTLSRTQRDFAMERAEARGCAERLDIRVQNVLDAELEVEHYDHVVFLESIIHMKEKAELFDRCNQALKPSGTLFVQESCYDKNSKDAAYQTERGRDAVDLAFGGTTTMVSAGEMQRLMEEAGLSPVYSENITNHYTRTLSQWLDNLDEHAEEMEAADPAFFPMLRKYLMLALATYRMAQTQCFLIAAQKAPLTWIRRHAGPRA
ncbi:MAG: class I SAM-dependent methyltransferase [Planctomycetes bacterium]|nr:class I SAM-dependent methyltransferase [Planctomycetota bacterium]